VSLRIAQLEDRLGERLLERTTRSLRLTDAGLAYYERVAPALQAMHEAERALETRKVTPSGRLRVSTTIEGGQFLLAPYFAAYMRRYPDVRLDVVLSDRQLDLIGERVDIAIRAGALSDSSLIARRLRFGGAMRFYASAKYLAKRGTPERPRDLLEHDCLVMPSQTRPTEWTFREGRKLVTVDVRPRASVNSFVVLATLAASHLGIARMPEYIAREVAPKNALRSVLDDFLPSTESPLHAVYPSARNLSPNVRAFLDLLDEDSPLF
jgi:DNA-binding transcriptional LysR family regulator